MFKRLLDSLKGKKSPDIQTPVSLDKAPAPDELITVYDAHGRELQITRAEWREKILVPNLEQAWSDPGKLYSLIVSALNDGFVADVDVASEQLLSIDPEPERSCTLRGIVLMKLQRLDEAETVLRGGIDKVGRSGVLQTNLAKVFAERGQSLKAEELLWESMTLDPNQENGLLWWAAIQSERFGEAGHVSALDKVAALPGSWLPQLWIARHRLQKNDVAGARALYEKVLSEGRFNAEALMMISGDLGNNHQIELIPELVAPHFDVQRHDPRAGINLLQAYLELGRVEEGEHLLGQLYALNIAPLKRHFDHYSAELGKLSAARRQSRPIESPDALEIESVAFDRPIWMYGLRDPAWFFAQKAERAQRIMFMSFAKLTDEEGGRAEEQSEDNLGRMTRAIPLYLAEAVHYWTDLKSQVLIPVVKGGGPVVFGAGGDDAELCTKFVDQAEYLVSGDIEEHGEAWHLTYRLWECSSRSCLTRGSIQTTGAELGAAVLELESRLLEMLGELRATPLDDFYFRPSVDAMEPYLSALGQGFMLTLLANQLAPKEGLWGERNMIDLPLRMALHWPSAEVLKLMYLSSLVKASDYGSSVLHEFKERTEALMRDMNRDSSPVAKLEPLVWKLFGKEDQLTRHQQSPGTDIPEGYREWLRRVVTPG